MPTFSGRRPARRDRPISKLPVTSSIPPCQVALMTCNAENHRVQKLMLAKYRAHLPHNACTQIRILSCSLARRLGSRVRKQNTNGERSEHANAAGSATELLRDRNLPQGSTKWAR